MFYWSKEGFSTKRGELPVEVLENLLGRRPIPRHIDIASIPHRVLIAIGATEIARNANGIIFDRHYGPMKVGSSVCGLSACAAF